MYPHESPEAKDKQNDEVTTSTKMTSRYQLRFQARFRISSDTSIFIFFLI
jgi:hypothetical protein